MPLPDQKKISVTLTEDEVWFIINECSEAHQAVGDHVKQFQQIAKKLQRRLEANGLEQPHHFGRKPTEREIADANFLKSLG